MPKIAVLLFPGTNSELEALRACKAVGLKAKVVRWNQPKEISKYDGYILPGGFSYEDRGRSGMVASKDPICSEVRAESEKGKPVLGICNGAQILVELNMIPHVSSANLQMALAWNERVKHGKILGVGFYNDWIYMRSDVRPRKSAFNYFENNVVMRVPVAHGEGRYVTSDPNLLQKLIENEQTVFRYCDAQGNIVNEFPVNPNNALHNLAGICNLEGNVMALMPHPERTAATTKVGLPIFASMKEYLEDGARKFTPVQKSEPIWEESKISEMTEKPDLEYFVKLMITDNEEWTIEQTLRKNGFPKINAKKYTYFGIFTEAKLPQINLDELNKKIVQTGVIANTHKEIPHTSLDEKGIKILTFDQDNYAGKAVAATFREHYGLTEIKEVKRGTLWVLDLDSADLPKLLETHILHNPHSMAATLY